MRALLETLARLEMKTEAKTSDVLTRALNSTWGASCVFFAYDENETTPKLRGHFMRRKIPVLFLVCRGPYSPADCREAGLAVVHGLDDLYLK
jgi:hypothetical protein